MPKILYIVTKSEWGGAQKYVFDLSKALKNEFEVLIAAGEGTGELFGKLKQENIRFIHLKHLKRFPSPFEALKAIREIRNLVKAEHADILHLNSTTAGFLGSIASKRPVVYTVHGWAFLEPGLLRKIFFFLLEKLSAPFKDKVIVLSEFEREIGKKITNPGKITVIPNGIGKLSFLSKEQARQELGLKQNGKYIGTIANLYKTKGLKYLAQTNLPNIVVIGEGPERKKLQKLKLLGQIPEAYKYLKAFDVFCLPSVKEGFPWVILEAMQAEVPIVGTKAGALPEIIEDGKEGFLAKPKNPEALKEKLFFLLQNQEEAKKMAQKAKEKSLQFTLEKMAQATKKVYQKLYSANVRTEKKTRG